VLTHRTAGWTVSSLTSAKIKKPNSNRGPKSKKRRKKAKIQKPEKSNFQIQKAGRRRSMLDSSKLQTAIHSEQQSTINK
jgi:hypothetical protein